MQNYLLFKYISKSQGQFDLQWDFIISQFYTFLWFRIQEKEWELCYSEVRVNGWCLRGGWALYPALLFHKLYLNGYHTNLKPPYQYFLAVKWVTYALYLTGTVYQKYIEHHVIIINVHHYCIIHSDMFCLECPILQMPCVCARVCVGGVRMCACIMCIVLHMHTFHAPVAYTLECTATSRQCVITATEHVSLMLRFWTLFPLFYA